MTSKRGRHKRALASRAFVQPVTVVSVLTNFVVDTQIMIIITE